MLAIAVLLALTASACGGGDSGDSATSPAAAGGESTAPTTAGGDGGSASGFRTPGGDNSIQEFGVEASTAEVDAATATLAAYLKARVAEDWEKDCAYLAKPAVAPLEQLAASSPRLKGKGCAAILAALASGTPRSTRANTMTGAVASLRIEGDRGFALYHGARGVDYFVPMVKEDGEWKLGTLSPSEFP
jgi:hypothetical protein